MVGLMQQSWRPLHIQSIGLPMLAGNGTTCHTLEKIAANRGAAPHGVPSVSGWGFQTACHLTGAKSIDFAPVFIFWCKLKARRALAEPVAPGDNRASSSKNFPKI